MLLFFSIIKSSARRTADIYTSKIWDTSAGTGKLCILGHLGLVFIWSCFVSCLLFLLFYASLRNLCSGTCRKIQDLEESNDLTRKYVMEIFKVRIRFSKLFYLTNRFIQKFISF